MFLTPAEAAWIGVVLGALLSGVSSWVVLAATRRKDHAQKLWERRILLYEDVLTEARRWQKERQPGNQRPSNPMSEDYENADRTHIRFAMIGEAKIENAYEQHFQCHWNWVTVAQMEWDAMKDNAQVALGVLPPEDRTDDKTLAKVRRHAQEARETADNAEVDLRKAVRASLVPVPRMSRKHRAARLTLERGGKPAPERQDPNKPTR